MQKQRPGIMLLLTLILLTLQGCASAQTVKLGGMKVPSKGVASYYGDEFHGRRTANGDRHDQGEMTAAHPTLPFGTRVNVTNVRNGRSVVVVVNDRGPFSRGRIIDLSQAAAAALGFKRQGTTEVTLKPAR